MKTGDVLISEVGPRDGLQSISSIMPTESKKKWITALAQSGIKEIEVGSFVPAKLLPQLADTAEIVAFARTIPDLQIAVLAPNYRGVENAIAAGAHKISIPLSVSETHSLRNVKRTHAQMLEEIAKIAAMIKTLPVEQRPHFEVGLATAFGCSIEGAVSEDLVFKLAEAAIAAGCDEVGLSDTTGSGNPAQLKRLLKGVWAAVGKDKLTGVHLHNTRGQGLANVLAAVEMGVETIDSSMGGIGGCPAAPGASGNIVTEDLVFLLESMGLNTGINFEALCNARNVFAELMPDVELYGFTPLAGLPKGFEIK